MPNENELLAALDDLEKSTIRKGGDALQNAPHDGGFATQGENIQSKAKIKKAIKSLVKSGFSKEEATKIVMKGFEDMGSDDESSEEPVAKGMEDDDSMSSDDDSGAGGDDDSDDLSGGEPPITKSTGAAQLANASSRRNEQSLRKALVDENPNMGDAFDAAPILGQLIDSIDRLAKTGNGPSKKELGDLRKSIVQIDNRQNVFNGKLAKALSLMNAKMNEQGELIKKMANEPVNTGNRAPSLRKSDLHEPSFHGNDQAKIGGNGGTGEPSPLVNVSYYEIQKALTDLCMKGQADLMDITKFENSKGNLSLLPPNVVKQLEDRLCAAA